MWLWELSEISERNTDINHSIFEKYSLFNMLRCVLSRSVIYSHRAVKSSKFFK